MVWNDSRKHLSHFHCKIINKKNPPKFSIYWVIFTWPISYKQKHNTMLPPVYVFNSNMIKLKFELCVSSESNPTEKNNYDLLEGRVLINVVPAGIIKHKTWQKVQLHIKYSPNHHAKATTKYKWYLLHLFLLYEIIQLVWPKDDTSIICKLYNKQI